MAQSKLIARRSNKKSTILVSKRTVEDAIRRANGLASAWMESNPNDRRIDELQNIVDHLSSILNKSSQEMRSEGASTVEDYFDDAVMGDQANVIKREVNMIAKWHDEQRAQRSQPSGTPQENGMNYAPDSALVMSSKKEKVMSDKKANSGAAFVTDRNEKGEAKAPEQLEVPRLAAKKKKEAEEDPAAAGALPAAAPAPVSAAPASSGSVNPIEYIPTETLIKVIEDMPKEDDFAQNKDKQDALIALTEILKARPVLAPEPDAAAAPAPVVASKTADDASPEAAKIDLGGLTVASGEDCSLEDEKTADDYRLHDYKLQEEGVVPSGRMPSMDEQEQHMHPEEEVHEASAPPHSENVVHALKDEPGVDNPFAVAWSMHNKGDKMSAVKAAIAAVNTILASGAAGGAWSTDHNEKGNVLEDGGRTPEVAEAHGMLDEAPAKLDRPESTNPMKFAADMSTSKALKQSESLGNDLKKMYLDAKSLTDVNDTRPVREAVEAIFRAADMFDEATKTLNKQHQQEESEAAAQEIKAKGKKSALAGLALAASE